MKHAFSMMEVIFVIIIIAVLTGMFNKGYLKDKDFKSHLPHKSNATQQVKPTTNDTTQWE